MGQTNGNLTGTYSDGTAWNAGPLPAGSSSGLDVEGVQDTVAGMIVAGSGVTATYDDAAGKLTLAATGSGAVNLSSAVVEVLSHTPATLQDAGGSDGIYGQGVQATTDTTITGFTLGVGGNGTRVGQRGAIARLDASNKVIETVFSTDTVSSANPGDYTFNFPAYTLRAGSRYILGLDSGGVAATARYTRINTTAESVSQGGLTLAGWLRSDAAGQAGEVGSGYRHKIRIINASRTKNVSGPLDFLDVPRAATLAEIPNGGQALYTGVTPPRPVYRAPDGTLYYGAAYTLS